MSPTLTASYNGDGLRMSSTTPSAPTSDFVWNTTRAVPELLMDGTNAYLYVGNNAPIEQVNLATGAVSYLVADALGSVRGIVSATGSLVASTAYD